MYKRIKICKKSEAKSIRWAVEHIMLSPWLAIAWVLDLLSQPVDAAPAVGCPRAEALDACVRASDPTAIPGTKRYALQVSLASVGRPLIGPPDVPTADLAPVLALPYYPSLQATSEAKPARKPRASRKPRVRSATMPAAASRKADPMAAALRRVARGEGVRAAAKAEGVSESTLRGRLKRAKAK